MVPPHFTQCVKCCFAVDKINSLFHHSRLAILVYYGMFTGPALSNQQAESVHLRGQANGRGCLANALQSGVMTAILLLEQNCQPHEFQDFDHFPTEVEIQRLHFDEPELFRFSLPSPEISIPDGATFHLSLARHVDDGSRPVHHVNVAIPNHSDDSDDDSDFEDTTSMHQVGARANPILIDLAPGQSRFDPIDPTIVVRESATRGPNHTVFVHEHSVDGHAILRSTDPNTPTAHILKFHVMYEGSDLWYFESNINNVTKNSYYDFIGSSRRQLFDDYGVPVCAPLPSCTRCQCVYNDLGVGGFVIMHCDCFNYHRICGSCLSRRGWFRYRCAECDVHPTQI